MKLFTRSILCIVALALSACHGDPNQTKLQYMPDMADAPTVKPYKDFLDPPEHSVPMFAILYPATAEESEKVLRNPYPASPDVVQHGKQLFDTFCIPCHGADAKGGGSITDIFPRPPDITAEMYAKRADGFFFHRITFGSVSTIMPGYGHAISANERWQIVHYVKSLQKR